MSDDTNYGSMDSLVPVEKLVNEAGEALSDKTRTISTSAIPEMLGAAAGLGAGAGLGVAALSASGTVAGLSAAGITSGLAALGGLVGGGMVAGLAVVAAPAVLLGGGAYVALSRYNHAKLVERKTMLLQEVIRKHDAIARALREENDANQERLDYLNALNIQLQRAFTTLQADLAA